MSQKSRQGNKKKLICAVVSVLLVAIVAVVSIVVIYPKLHTKAVAEVASIKAREFSQRTGWVTSEGRSYYYKNDGKKAIGATDIDGQNYFFDLRLGQMKTGWIDVDGQKSYYNEDGTRAVGAVNVGEEHYYFDQQGKMVTGWVEDNGERFYYGEDGQQYFGRHDVDGQSCWFNVTTGAYTELTCDPDKPMIALTWDDGPAPATKVVLDALEASGGRGTFFVVGNRIPYYEADVKRAVELGCEIANHTWEHAYLDKLSAEAIVSQLTQTNDIVEQLTGVRPTLMRPTGGRVNDTVRANVGMPMIYWSVDTEDWKTKNTQSTIDSVLSKAYDGAIILMHDLQDTTGEAAKTIIPELINRGYQLVTVSEMAAARGVTMENGVLYYDFAPAN